MKLPLLALTLSCLFVCGCNNNEEPASGKPAQTSANQAAQADKLKITEIEPGAGPRKVENGDSVWLQYRGTFNDGKMFQSNFGPNDPLLSFAVGSGQVVKGMDEGVVGMRIGGRRKLHLPSSLAYGANGKDGIPPNSDLNFEIKLLGLVKVGQEHVIDEEEIKPGAGDRVAKTGDKVAIRYVGRLLNGKVFDDQTAKPPFVFKIGAGDTLPAIDKGVQGMKVGGVRKILAPPETAFAAEATPSVPANSEVVFTVTLVGFK